MRCSKNLKKNAENGLSDMPQKETVTKGNKTKNTKRLFVALNLPQQIKEKIYSEKGCYGLGLS
mgnify:CR=1 FL=1